jgi:hypothetical protein
VVTLPLTLYQPRKTASLREAPLLLGEPDRRLEVGEVRYGGPVGTRQAMAQAETVTCRTVPHPALRLDRTTFTLQAANPVGGQAACCAGLAPMLGS